MCAQEEVQRQYYRTKARLNIRFGPFTQKAASAMVLEDEALNIHSEIEQNAKAAMDEGLFSESLKPLMDVMRFLDLKLDIILHHLRFREIEEFLPYRAFTTDLSGSGFGLSDDLKLKTGEKIICAITLPDSPGRPLFTVAQISRLSESDKKVETKTACTFVNISESDRERLIRYTFRQQRRQLASRSGENGK